MVTRLADINVLTLRVCCLKLAKTFYPHSTEFSTTLKDLVCQFSTVFLSGMAIGKNFSDKYYCVQKFNHYATEIPFTSNGECIHLN